MLSIKFKMTKHVHPLRFYQIYAEMFALDESYSVTRHEMFSSTFGVSPVVASILWNKMHSMELLPFRSIPLHLLWSLFFMKVYNSNKVMAGLVSASVPTFTKWVWEFIFAIAKMKIVVVSKKIMTILWHSLFIIISSTNQFF